MKYKCVITSNTSTGREYETTSRNVMKIAEEFGRAECGEEVTITDKRGNVLSRAVWDTSTKKYIRVAI